MQGQDLSFPLLNMQTAYKAWYEYKPFIVLLPSIGHVVITNSQKTNSHRAAHNSFRDFFDSSSPKRLMRLIERYGLMFDHLKTYDRAQTYNNMVPCDKDILRKELSSYPDFRESELDYIINKYGGFETRAVEKLRIQTAAPMIRYDFITDYAALWNMLKKAIELRYLADNTKVTRHQMENAGFTILKEGYFLPVEIPDSKHYESFLINSNSPLGNQVFLRLFDVEEKHFYLYDYETNNSYIKNRIIIDDLNAVVNEFLNCIIGMHTDEIRLIPTGKQLPTISNPTVLSEVWFGLYGAFETGRIGRCQECNLLFIAGKERGTPRKFCSDRCRKANSRKLVQYPTPESAVRDSSSKQAEGGEMK